MQLISKKNFIIFLAAILVVSFGFMALTLTKRKVSQKTLSQSEKEIQQIEKQSTSDEITAIEKDLNDTDLVDLDKELQDIEDELDTIEY